MTVPPYPNHPPGQIPVPPRLLCRFCGLSPAAVGTFRTQVGFVVGFSIRPTYGPFCRTCGTALFRNLTTDALQKGWWSGLSLVIVNWCVLAANLWNFRQVKRLPKGPTLPWPPLSPGKPIHKRPAAYIAIVPILWAVCCITGATIEALT